MIQKISITFFSLFLVFNISNLMAQDIKMCGYQGYQTVEEVNSACDLYGAETTYESDDDAAVVVDNILDKIGLFRNFNIEECVDINNALAVTMPLEGGDIERFILYDNDFFTKVSNSTGTDWGLTSILAHEVGHHLNGHTLKGGGSNHRIELQADEFSGFVLARMGCSLEDAQSAVSNLLPDEASSTHPAKQDRLDAIAKGWNRGNGNVIEVKPVDDNVIAVIEESNEEFIEIDGVTTEQVLSNYIDAIGGQEKIRKIQAMYYDMQTKKADGTPLMTQRISYLTPTKLYADQLIHIPNMKDMKTESMILDGIAYTKEKGKWKKGALGFEDMKQKQPSFVDEYSQLVNNTPIELIGVRKIKGEACYALKFPESDYTTMEMPGNKTTSSYVKTKYYSVKTGFLFMEERIMTMDTDFEKETEYLKDTHTVVKTEIFYVDYKPVNEVLFSFKQETISTILESNNQYASFEPTLQENVFAQILVNPVIDMENFRVR